MNNFLIYGSTEIPILLVYLLKYGHLFHNGPKMLKICFKKKIKKKNQKTWDTIIY